MFRLSLVPCMSLEVFVFQESSLLHLGYQVWGLGLLIAFLSVFVTSVESVVMTFLSFLMLQSVSSLLFSWFICFLKSTLLIVSKSQLLVLVIFLTCVSVFRFADIDFRSYFLLFLLFALGLS